MTSLTASLSSNVTVHPPNPAPVIREPYTRLSCLASSTSLSNS